jgi:predicted transposase YdaD
MPDHDALYHRLFSHPGMVAQLLREFDTEPWVADLALDAMERVNAKFHAEDGERRESDVVWRIPLKAGGDAYLLLLLEFQSTQDRWMALRVMVYAGLLWQQIIRERRLTPEGRLPPVFPLVIYNGDTNWTTPASLHALIGLPEGSPLWRWQPDMRYDILDEGAFAEADLVPPVIDSE